MYVENALLRCEPSLLKKKQIEITKKAANKNSRPKLKLNNLQEFMYQFSRVQGVEQQDEKRLMEMVSKPKKSRQKLIINITTTRNQRDLYIKYNIRVKRCSEHDYQFFWQLLEWVNKKGHAKHKKPVMHRIIFGICLSSSGENTEYF